MSKSLFPIIGKNKDEVEMKEKIARLKELSGAVMLALSDKGATLEEGVNVLQFTLQRVQTAANIALQPTAKELQAKPVGEVLYANEPTAPAIQ